MTRAALGMVEVLGLVTAMGVADAMAKAAPVSVQRPQSIGDGFVTVVVSGDVASVTVAVESGVEAALRIGRLVSSRVIGRPFEGVAEGFALTEEDRRGGAVSG